MVSKKVIIVAALAALITSQAGCSSAEVSYNKSAQQKTAGNTASKQENKEKGTANELNTLSQKVNSGQMPNTPPPQDNGRYKVAGIDNAIEFEAAFKQVQELVSEGDKKMVAEYIRYPIVVYIDGTKTEINTEDEFVKNYDKILTEKIKKALMNQKVKETFVNYKGVMVGQGEIWFTITEEGKHKYSIYGINN